MAGAVARATRTVSGDLAVLAISGTDPQSASAAKRLAGFLDSDLSPTQDGPAIALAANSICVHGDSPGAVTMARQSRSSLTDVGVTITAFMRQT